MKLNSSLKPISKLLILMIQIFLASFVLQSCAKSPEERNVLRTGSTALLVNPAAKNLETEYTASETCILANSKKDNDYSKRKEVANLIAAFYLLGMEKSKTGIYAYYLANYPYQIDRYNPSKECYSVSFSSILYNWENGKKLPSDPINWVKSLPSCLYSDKCETQGLYNVSLGKKLKRSDHPNLLKTPPRFAAEKELNDYEKRLLARGFRDAKKICKTIAVKLNKQVKQNCDSI